MPILRNFKVTFQYQGTHFLGWQVQKDLPSVQQTFSEALEKIIQEKPTLIASGRTDAGVHALAQVINFKTQSKILAIKLKAALNFYLGEEVAVTAVEEVALSFHAQKDAKRKTYRYLIQNGAFLSPLAKQFCWYLPYSIDWKKVKEALKVIEGKNDFKSFQSVGTPVLTTTRKIFWAKLRKIKSPFGFYFYALEFCGEGFLKQMVRNLVGTLVDVGRGKTSLEEFKEILKAKDRKKAGPAAPPQGLYLVQVMY